MKSKTEEVKNKEFEKIMKELHEHLAYWQRQLRLDGVEIKLRWMNFDECKENDALGVWYNYSPAHLFEIGFAHTFYRESECSELFNCDYEVILVHELLHILDSSWEDKREVQQAFENEVIKELQNNTNDIVAEALVRARRGITR